MLSVTCTMSASSKEPVDPLTEHQPAFLELGKKFCVLAELWVNDSALGRPYPATMQDNGPWSADRYDSAASKQDGVTAEIYTHVPQEFHKLVHVSPLFSSTVCGPASISLLISISHYPQVSQWYGGSAWIHHRHDPQMRHLNLPYLWTGRFRVQNHV